MNTLLATLALVTGIAVEQEKDFWTIHDVPEPEGIALEVGGILALGNGKVMVCTRRGQVWVIDHAYDDTRDPVFTLWTDGLQEPLGLNIHPDDRAAWKNSIATGEPYTGNIWTVQRGELTRMRDTDGDF